MVRESHLKNHQFFLRTSRMVMRCQFSRCDTYLLTLFILSLLQSSKEIAWNCILFLKTHVIHLLTSLKRCLDSCGQSSRWLSIDKRVARMNGSRWSWWALRSNQCWHYPVCSVEEKEDEHQRVRHKRRHPHRSCCCYRRNCGQSCYCCCLLETLSRWSSSTHRSCAITERMAAAISSVGQ